MRTLLYLWRMLPPVGRVVVLAAPAVGFAAVIALWIGGRS
ncbi:DUF4175 domain-containing protein [Actinomadura sp. KC216]|nr:DUF4175 domain-containing protein [Actinomadura sp. KC216]